MFENEKNEYSLYKLHTRTEKIVEKSDFMHMFAMDLVRFKADFSVYSSFNLRLWGIFSSSPFSNIQFY